MSGLQGVDDVLTFLDKRIDALSGEPVLDRTYLNWDVISLLTEIRDGLKDERPTWAEVTISEVIDERDRARTTAVRLEQELARAEALLRSSFRWFVFHECGSWYAALRSADGELRGHWRSFKSRKKAVRFARKHSGEAL